MPEGYRHLLVLIVTSRRRGKMTSIELLDYRTILKEGLTRTSWGSFQSSTGNDYLVLLSVMDGDTSDIPQKKLWILATASSKCKIEYMILLYACSR